ncbi:mannose-specific lectin-like [Nymphaea colorata]|nr:mannose-specific lectin-like [Nymphaea colorata]
MGRHEIWLLLFCSLLCNLQPSCQQAYNTMFSGDSLLSGQYLTFSNNVLTMQSVCNLVLKRGGISIWSSDTSGGGKNCTLKLQLDGNLLIYSQNNTAVWSTALPGTGARRTIRRPVGSPFLLQRSLSLTYSSDVVASNCAVKLFRSGEPTNVLYSYEYLLPGQSLATGDDALVMQSDCNLVLYRKRTAIWASGTSGRGTNCILSMQNDGDLVIYQDGDQVWNAGAGGKTRRHYVLALGRDGNLGIYGGAVWATGTFSTSLSV